MSRAVLWLKQFACRSLVSPLCVKLHTARRTSTCLTQLFAELRRSFFFTESEACQQFNNCQCQSATLYVQSSQQQCHTHLSLRTYSSNISYENVDNQYQQSVKLSCFVSVFVQCLNTKQPQSFKSKSIYNKHIFKNQYKNI